ncbi:hypothetical protein ANN_21685 [Periplaneta americana]|uniref:Uncharacterized protein n=1 Tax=Periplaneta americana TaxID=6978 RepID=A0ABQ8S6R3_PERAM|nr:hypothetical protein ANN_21685 [Periplaneta americana]
MDLREVGYDDRDWINLAQDRDRWRAYREEEKKEKKWRSSGALTMLTIHGVLSPYERKQQTAISTHDGNENNKLAWPVGRLLACPPSILPYSTKHERNDEVKRSDLNLEWSIVGKSGCKNNDAETNQEDKRGIGNIKRDVDHKGTLSKEIPVVEGTEKETERYDVRNEQI